MEQVVAGFRGRLLLCDLCFEALGIEADELRSRAEIASVTAVLAECQDATCTFCF
jgi:hypothetical protein